MPVDNWYRLSALTGLAAAVLYIVAFVAFSPPADSTGWASSEWLKSHDTDGDKWLTGATLWAFGNVFLLWFSGTIRDWSSRAEGGIGRYSTLVFGGTLGTGLLWAAAAGVSLIVMRWHDDVAYSGESLRLMEGTINGLAMAGGVSAGVMALAAGLAGVRWGTFPKWLSWIGVAVGMVLVVCAALGGVPAAVMGLGLMAWFAWLAMTSVWLFMSAATMKVDPADRMAQTVA